MQYAIDVPAPVAYVVASMSNEIFIKLLESARELRQQRVRRLTRLARAVGGRPRPRRDETAIDVRAVRAMTGLSQAKFAELLSIEVSTLRNWEQGRRDPTGPARALLRAIRNEPVAVIRALTD
jgi:putative transcriptional regulator